MMRMAGEINGTARTGMGSLLKRYRQARGVTQRELAAAAGLSIGTLRDLEQGRTRFPRWGMVEGLATVLGLGQAQRAELTQAGRAADRGAARQPAGRIGGLRIQILGPLTVWRDGVPVELGSARQRATLGLLALHHDTGLHRNAIIDALWGDNPPASAVPEVQGYVSRLRKVVSGGPADAGITTVAGCRYHLTVGAGQLDLAAFRQATREVRSARPEPARACDLYEQALGMWGGDLLADVDLLRGHPAAVEVARQRAETVLGYAEAAMLAGVPGRVLPHLRGLCAGEPLNEHAHARLMVALAATGQQAAALQVFTELRTLLDAEFGIAPSPVLARAQALVLRQRVSSRADRPAVSFLSQTDVVRAPA
jgi:DNA-binding SARP family transcriptional activator/DNA-binding XRE family transcriptional regulator